MGSFSGLLRDERGAVAVVVAVLLVVLLGFTALVIDFGWLFVVNSELQNGADAGCLAGVVGLGLNDTSLAENTAITYATELSQYRLNNPAPKADAVTVTIGGVLGPETLQVQIRRTSDTTAGAVPTIFARAWGKDTMTTDVIAGCTLDRCIIGAGPGNLIPYAIHQDWLLERDTDGDGAADGTHNAYPKDFSESQFGLVDFDGGENSNQEIKDWIHDGYDGILVLEEDCDCIYMEADPGISGGSVNRVIEYRIDYAPLVLMPVFTEVIEGEPVEVPILDPITGEPTGEYEMVIQAAETIFKVVDFVAGKIVSSKLTGAQEDRELMIDFDTNYSAANLITGDDCVDLNPTVSKPVLIR